MSLRVLTLSSLYPNPLMPRHGIFVHERLKQLIRRCPVESTVIAPVPWFPSAQPRWGRYGVYAAVPASEQRDGIPVHHPRFVAIPAVGNALNPIAMAWSILRCIRRARIVGFDAIDAHYAFPDGVAAGLIARRLEKPLVITVRGSDINTLPHEFAAGRWLRRSLPHADAVIAVSNALAQKVVTLVPALADRVRVHRNGVDTDRFFITDSRDETRRHLRAPDRLLVLCVGNLVPLKQFELVIRAMVQLAEATLVIAGSGPERRRLEALADTCGVADRVRFQGVVEQPLLIDLYNAADVTVLPSKSEGMPNVLLESLACGTPVVATDVGDLRELFGCSSVVEIVDAPSPDNIAQSISRLAQRRISRSQVSTEARRFGWEPTCDGVFQTLNDAVRRFAESRRMKSGAVP